MPTPPTTGSSSSPGPGSSSSPGLASTPQRPPEETRLIVPEPVGLPPPLAEAFGRAMTEVHNLIQSKVFEHRFATVLLTMLRTTPTLTHCTPESIVLGIVEMARHNLDPSAANECWLIPYEGKAQLQIGYGGLIKLACSHPDVVDVVADEVCQKDTYEFFGVDTRPQHVYPAAFAPRGRPVGYYAVATLTHGRVRAVQMSVEEVKAHAQHFSQNALKKLWSDGKGGGFRGMAMKTVLRKICNTKYLPMSGQVHDLIWSMEREEGAPRPPWQEPAPLMSPEDQARPQAEHIADLCGPPPEDPTTRLVRDAIGRILTEQGLSGEEIRDYWSRLGQKYPDLSPGVLAMVRDKLLAAAAESGPGTGHEPPGKASPRSESGADPTPVLQSLQGTPEPALERHPGPAPQAAPAPRVTPSSRAQERRGPGPAPLSESLYTRLADKLPRLTDIMLKDEAELLLDNAPSERELEHMLQRVDDALADEAAQDKLPLDPPDHVRGQGRPFGEGV